MADIASVLDAASAVGAQVGRQDVIPVGQAAKPGGAFFAVLASRMGPVAKVEVKGEVDAILAMKGGKGDASLNGVDLLSAAPTIDPDATEPASAPTRQAQPDQTMLPVVIGDLARQPVSPAGLAPGQVVATTEASLPEEDAFIDVFPESSRHSARALAGETKAAAGTFVLAGGQSNSAANAAEDPGAKGQLLPPITSNRFGAEQAVAPLADMSKEGAGEVLSLLSVTSPANGAASPGTDISFSRAFEQALRPAETRLNVSVDAPVRSSAFSAELGEKIVWLVGRQGQIAEISLNPPHMGTLEVRLTVSGGEAGAQFFSVNPAVRDAIEAALPRLRELMAQAGITLGEAQVRDEAFMQGRQPDAPDLSPSGAVGEADVGGDMRGLGSVRARGVGLVDLYV